MKKHILTFLTAVLLLAAGACAQSKEYPKAPKYYPHPKGEFPIGAQGALYGEYMTDQQAQWAVEAGINVFMTVQSIEELDTLLSLARKYDTPMSIGNWELRNNKTKEVAELYSKDPLVWFYSLWDEPKASQFEKLKLLGDTVRKYAPGKNVFFNLLPAMEPEQLGAPSYRDYVEDFVRTVNPPFISVDVYPIRLNKQGEIYVDNCEYRTMEVIREVSRESKRPFWHFVLSNSTGFYPKPTAPYLRFQIFTGLGYGSQAVLYWTYTMPNYDIGAFTSAPIDYEGKRTSVWYDVREVNREVQNLSKVFLGADVTDVSQTGEHIPAGTKRLGVLPAPFTVLESYGQGVMVSQIRNGSDNYLMVINRDVTEKQKVYLGRTRKVTRLYGNGKVKADSGPYFTLDPGGYAIFKY